VDMRLEDVSGGVEQTIRALSPGGSASLHLARQAEIALGQTALAVLELSQDYVPVDTGDLKASVSLTHDGSGFEVVYTIGYHTDYAVFVHEITEYYHRPPTGAKYLSRAVTEVVNGGGPSFAGLGYEYPEALGTSFTGDFGVI
jgi:hypothetical protein